MSWQKFLSTLPDTDPGEHRRILVIDDDPEVMRSIENFLTQNGFRVTTSTDGLNGLKKYYSEHPDLIITDTVMPGMSAPELLEKIRTHDQDTGVIMLLAPGDLEGALKALGNAVFDVLMKPADLQVLLVTVNNALHRSDLKKQVALRTRELERLLDEVNTSRKNLETIIRNSPHAMISYGKKGRIESWNDEAQRITGFSRHEAEGKTLRHLLLLQDHLVEPEKAGPEDGYKHVIGQIMTKDRELRSVSRFANVLVDPENKVVGGVESFVDITEILENNRLLEKRFLQVRTINEIGKRIAGSISLSDLTGFICQHLVDTFFESAQVSLSLRDKEKKQLVLKATAGKHSADLIRKIPVGSLLSPEKGIQGKAFRTAEKQLVRDYDAAPETYDRLLENARSGYAFPVRSGDEVSGVLHIENIERIDLDESDIWMLEALSEYIGISAERVGLLGRITQQNSLLGKQAAELKKALKELESRKEIIEKQNAQFIEELNKAGEFQKRLLPEQFPEIPGLTFSASYTPSSRLGGDLYDVFRIGPSHVGFLVADASGHGVTAAMLSAMFKMTLGKYAFEIVDPSEVLTRMNRDFCNVLQMGEFFTAFYGIYALESKELTYCNAAHPYPLLFDYRKQSVVSLDTEGFLLGVMERDIRYESGKLNINGPCRLVIFTDGLTETINQAGELYGDLRLKHDLKNRRNDDPERFMKAVLKDVSQYADEETFKDDITILVVDFYRENHHDHKA